MRGLGKVQKPLPVLTTRYLSPMMRGKVYTACAPSDMLYGRETWGPNTFDPWLLCQDDCTMICWICGTKNPQLQYYTNWALTILQQSFTVNSFNGMDMYNMSRPESNMSQTFQFSLLKGEDGAQIQKWIWMAGRYYFNIAMVQKSIIDNTNIFF